MSDNDSLMLSDEKLAWLTLKLAPGVGNRSLWRLYRHFGSAERILSASGPELDEVPQLRAATKDALLHRKWIRSPREECEKLRELDINLLTIEDSCYPVNLKTIPDAPVVLFVKGTLQPRDLIAVAVVGSRVASPAGLAYTDRLCAELTQYGVTIVSGLAVGIDSAAHRGALKGRGRTLAVLGCGLDVNYPPSNRRLKDEIFESGALLSEFPIHTMPAAGHFPQRNRIISGLALGVVVVEAAPRSGSLITARLALEQGREVFAVPGAVGSLLSAGPHRLLKEGAKLVESAEDILEEIRPQLRSRKPHPAGPVKELPSSYELTTEEIDIIEALRNGALHIDELSRGQNVPAGRLMALLMELELKGLVKQLPGKSFAAVV